MKNSILIFGSGRQAKVTIDIIQSIEKFDIHGIIDGNSKVDNIFDIPVIGSESILSDLKINSGVIAVGDAQIRKKIHNKINNIISNFEFINAISPYSTISKSVKIQNGTQIMAGAVINCSSIVKSHSIVNTNSNIDHDCIISEYVNINPGVSIGGNVEIGKGTTIGIGSSIIDEINIGENSFIGAGSNVVKDIPSNVVAYGNPCKVIRYIS